MRQEYTKDLTICKEQVRSQQLKLTKTPIEACYFDDYKHLLEQTKFCCVTGSTVPNPDFISSGARSVIEQKFAQLQDDYTRKINQLQSANEQA